MCISVQISVVVLVMNIYLVNYPWALSAIQISVKINVSNR